MSRIGPSQTVLPNRISCLCVESIRRIRRTPVFGVRGAASARSALSFRCKQVCLDSFFTRNTLVAGFFLPYFPPSPPGPGRSTPSSHFVSFDSLRFSPKSAYLYLQDPAYAKCPRRRGKTRKKARFQVFSAQKNARNNDKSQIARARLHLFDAFFTRPRPSSARDFTLNGPLGPIVSHPFS